MPCRKIINQWTPTYPSKLKLRTKIKRVNWITESGMLRIEAEGYNYEKLQIFISLKSASYQNIRKFLTGRKEATGIGSGGRKTIYYTYDKKSIEGIWVSHSNTHAFPTRDSYRMDNPRILPDRNPACRIVKITVLEKEILSAITRKARTKSEISEILNKRMDYIVTKISNLLSKQLIKKVGQKGTQNLYLKTSNNFDVQVVY